MRVEDLFKRLKREYFKIKLLQSFLDTLIIVLLLNLGAIIINFSYDLRMLAVIGLAFFLSRFYYLSRNYSVEIYENQNQSLEELLRTARDNLDRRDEITQALFEDVMDRARKMSSETIIPSDRVFQKLFLIGGLAILTAVSGLVAPTVSFEAPDFQDSLPGPGIGEEEKANSSEIMGDSIDIDTTGTDVNISVEGEGESFEEGFRKGLQDEELMFEASDDRLDRDLELAKRYSVAIRGLE
ncbi:MAG: hypothetical protein ACLFTA_00755 [Candidatus Nanohaloarchaea archaeon]